MRFSLVSIRLIWYHKSFKQISQRLISTIRALRVRYSRLSHKNYVSLMKSQINGLKLWKWKLTTKKWSELIIRYTLSVDLMILKVMIQLMKSTAIWLIKMNYAKKETWLTKDQKLDCVQYNWKWIHNSSFINIFLHLEDSLEMSTRSRLKNTISEQTFGKLYRS